jgi:preprotein translocase subunit SecD
MPVQGRRFSVIHGNADAPLRIAFSLAHPRERIDVPVREVRQVEVVAEETFYHRDSRTLETWSRPVVRVALKPAIRALLYRLTRPLVEQPLAIIVAGEVIARPIVREPLGTQENFCISYWDLDDAKEVAAKIRKGWVVPYLRVV